MDGALNFAERRVLGVLMEKGFTTPEQYPLTLNSLVNGCNQKSCRDPVSHLAEDEVVHSLDSLREKGLVTIVRSTSGRTDRYRHRCADTLELEGRPSAVLAELLLRGPQTDGELRQRASRMVEIPTLADLAITLDELRRHEPCLLMPASPVGRRRGAKYAHALYPADERPDSVSDTPVFTAEAISPSTMSVASQPTATLTHEGPSSGLSSSTPTATVTGSQNPSGLHAELVQVRDRIDSLERRVDELESTFMRFFK